MSRNGNKFKINLIVENGNLSCISLIYITVKLKLNLNWRKAEYASRPHQ